jgi:hypothetical protein
MTTHSRPVAPLATLRKAERAYQRDTHVDVVHPE